MQPRILIAGIGNVFLGDDGFGVEVVRRLMREPLPQDVRVADFGIRGFDLAYALLDAVDIAILVDAVPPAGAPGTLHVIEAEPEMPGASAGPVAIDTHAMDPAKVLRLASSLGAQVKRVLVVGCEPQMLGEDDMLMGLSPPAEAAVPQAVSLVKSLVSQLLGARPEINPAPDGAEDDSPGRQPWGGGSHPNDSPVWAKDTYR